MNRAPTTRISRSTPPTTRQPARPLFIGTRLQSRERLPRGAAILRLQTVHHAGRPCELLIIQRVDRLEILRRLLAAPQPRHLIEWTPLQGRRLAERRDHIPVARGDRP